MKIKTQILVLGLLLSIVPLGLVSSLIVSVYSEELNGIAENDLRTITAAQVDIIDTFFESCDINMSIISEYAMLWDILEQSNAGEAEKIDETNRNMIKEIFDVQKQKQGFINSITAVDMELRVLVSTEVVKNEKATPLENMDALEALGHDIWFSNIIEKGKFDIQERCLVAIKAIYDGEKCVGYLIEEINLDFFENLRISENVMKGGSIYIADGSGGLITAGTGEEHHNEYILEKNQRGEFSKAWENRDTTVPIGVVSYEIAGKEYLTSYGSFQNSNWQILSSVCLDDILHTRDSFIRVLLMGAVVTILAVYFVNRIMRKTLMVPIEDMIQIFTGIRDEKDFSRRIQGIPRNELRVIADEVNGLLEDIEITLKHQDERLKNLKEQAERDSMTELFNKSTIREILSVKIDNARVNKDMLACILVDIDDFKTYNTCYGHPGGDEVIRFVAKIMRELSGDNAGRIGGDEFIMCLDHLRTKEDAVSAAEEFMKLLKEGLDMNGDGGKVSVPCSVGIKLMSGKTVTTYDNMVEMADKAMYKVKNTTKNGYYIFS